LNGDSRFKNKEGGHRGKRSFPYKIELFLPPTSKNNHITIIMSVCEFCNTDFKYKKQYQEHIVCCEFIHARGKERNANVDLADDQIPSQRMMYELLKNLMLKNQQLEAHIEELKKFVKKEKTKINVIEYLSSHQYPSMDYSEMMKMMVVQTKHLDAVLSGNIIDGVCSLFADIEPQYFPIAAFSHKNSFYVYKDTMWQEFPGTSINAMFDILSNRFMKAYQVWEKSRPELAIDTEEVQKQKMIWLRKIIGTSMADEYKYRRFSTWIYEKLKRNIKTIVEYEFD
jgi:hypothetical protein